MKYVYECRILLVDDNLQLQEMICDMLHREGFSHIDTASSCADALLYFSRQNPDIVILDIGLPDGDGFSLMQKIRSLSDIPVLFYRPGTRTTTGSWGWGWARTTI